MTKDFESILRSTPSAPWLPPSGQAGVVRSAIAPSPTSLVRLLIRRGEYVFCVPRDGSGKVDLPTQSVRPEDPDGRIAAIDLAPFVLGRTAAARPVGFVRNVVVTATDDYDWPIPLAHFSVWAAGGEPAIAGTWIRADASSEVSDRHWFPLLSRRTLAGSSVGARPQDLLDRARHSASSLVSAQVSSQDSGMNRRQFTGQDAASVAT